MFLMQRAPAPAVVKPRRVVGAMRSSSPAVTTRRSLIPSFLAARLKPVTAMHHIG